ncbi:MAG: rhodanese-like domain-containing protein [Anaerovoracaceae bacterium]
MKKILIIASIMALVAVLAACSSNKSGSDSEVAEPEKAISQIITQEDAEKMLKEEGTVLLDVRTEEEYNEGHIPNAILLPDYDIQKEAGNILPDKEAKIIVYCRSGKRSASAAAELAAMGYKNVYDLGGIQSWTGPVE